MWGRSTGHPKTPKKPAIRQSDPAIIEGGPHLYAPVLDELRSKLARREELKGLSRKERAVVVGRETLPAMSGLRNEIRKRESYALVLGKPYVLVGLRVPNKKLAYIAAPKDGNRYVPEVVCTGYDTFAEAFEMLLRYIDG